MTEIDLETKMLMEENKRINSLLAVEHIKFK